MQPSARTSSGLAALLLAILAISTGAPFVRLAQPAPALTVAALRVCLAAIVFLAIGRDAVARVRALPAVERRWVGAAGLLFGAHLGLWITSLYFTSTAASVALVATSPVFAAVFGLLLGDRVRPREWLGIAIAGAGCALLAGGDWRAGGLAVLGDALSVLAAACAAAYLVVGRRLRAAMPLAPYLALVNGVAGAGLLVAAVGSGAPLIGLPALSYVGIAGGALVASLGGHTLLNWAVRRTPTHLVALCVLGEPVGSSLLTWAIFGERPPAHAVVGGAVILVGIGVGFAGRRG